MSSSGSSPDTCWSASSSASFANVCRAFIVKWVARGIRAHLDLPQSGTGKSPGLRGFFGDQRLFLAATQGMDVDRQRLDGRLAQAAAPGRHHVTAAISQTVDDHLLVRTVEPNLVG